MPPPSKNDILRLVKPVNRNPKDAEVVTDPLADIMAEASVLASMFLGGKDAVQTAATLLDGTEFYREAHAEIFRAMIDMHQRGVTIDVLTLKAALTDRGKLESVGGIAYLMQLGEIVPTTANLHRYAQTVRSKSVQRLIIESTARIASMARAEVPLSELHAELSSVIERAEAKAEPFPEKPGSLAAELSPVPRFNPRLLPDVLRPWVYDIAQRMSCPIEYVAAPAIVAVSALIGRRLAIRPKQHDDWAVVPNLWGAIVGSPGALKTPAVSEALRPLHRIERQERDKHEFALKDYQSGLLVAKAKADAAQSELKRKAKAKADPDELKRLASEAIDEGEGERPTCPRLVVNDTTVEKLGELLKENPNGLLQFRDELAGFLRALDKQGHETDRAFYLEAWNGDKSFDYDRIGRGNVHIPAVCLSVFGTIQPAVIARFIRSGVEDGFPQRLQLMVYPDPPRTYKMVDRYPNTESKNRVFEVLEWIYNLTPEQIGAIVEEGELPYLRFDPEAQAFFYQWFERLENRLRSMTETPAFVAHLSKFRSLMPSMALIMHLLSGNPEGAVSLDAAQRGAMWCEFLEAHARRVYVMATEGDAEPAQTLAGKIKAGALPEPFTYRQVVQKGWSGLTDTDSVARAVAFLESRHWVRVVEVYPEGDRGGRPSVQVHVNPALKILQMYDSTHLQNLQNPEVEAESANDFGDSIVSPAYKTSGNAPAFPPGESVPEEIARLGAEVNEELRGYFAR